MEKKDGGKIKNWQLHNLTYDKNQIILFREMYPEVKIEPMIMTGTLVDDPTGRWKKGHHMRSSAIVDIDREKGIIETLNTIYHMDMKTENKDMIPDLGNGVLGLFY